MTETAHSNAERQRAYRERKRAKEDRLREEMRRLQQREQQEQACPDPLITALFDRLPKPGSVWTQDERVAWVAAAEAAFDLIYPEGPRQK